MPHAALWVVQLLICNTHLRQERFNAARGFVGGATPVFSGKEVRTFVFQCRTRLCGWCNLLACRCLDAGTSVSMPHAALWVVQLKPTVLYGAHRKVSMPHAALWVVQPEKYKGFRTLFLWVSMPHAALWVVQPHRSQPLSPYGEKALLESLRKFEMSDGKYVKYLFLFSFSLRRNPLRDQHLARP